MDYEAALAAINKSLGPPPRRLDHGDKYNIEPWCYANFGWLAGIGFGEILKRGEVLWAALVQANQALFYPDPEYSNWPATVVYARDLAREPEALLPIAQQLYATKGRGSRNGDLRKIGAALAKETQPTARLRVPMSVTGGVRCAMIDVAFDRRHMPHGVLIASLFPILVHRRWRWAVLVPFWHWPKEYREAHWSPR